MSKQRTVYQGSDWISTRFHDGEGNPVEVPSSRVLDLFLHLIRDHEVRFELEQLQMPRAEADTLWREAHLAEHANENQRSLSR